MLRGPSSRLSAPVIYLVVGALLMLTTACSASPTRSATPSESSSRNIAAASSPPPSASPLRAPTHPVPALPPPRATSRNARAFARVVMAAWSQALRTDDPRPLSRLGPGRHRCRGCAALARTLGNRRKAGWHVDFPGLDIHRIAVAGRRPRGFVATAAVSIPASTSSFSDGRFRNANPAHPHATFTTAMRVRHRHWVLVSFEVG